MRMTSPIAGRRPSGLSHLAAPLMLSGPTSCTAYVFRRLSTTAPRIRRPRERAAGTRAPETPVQGGGSNPCDVAARAPATQVWHGHRELQDREAYPRE